MRSLLLLNGSPRGAKANSALIAGALAEGWEAQGGQARTWMLTRKSEFAGAVQGVHAAASEGDSATIVLVTPLYTDAMPGLVMAFIEELEPLVGRMTGVRLGFVVHSGFDEALHSRPLERYFEKLARRLGAEYAGTIVKGGSEPLRLMPGWMTRKLWVRMRGLAASLSRDGRFDPELLRVVAGTERIASWRLPFYKVLLRTPMARSYWHGQLKENGAFEERLAAPYGEAAR